MLIKVPVTEFLFLSFSSSTGLTIAGVALSLWWFRRSLRRAGVRLHLGTPAVAPA
jgi:hypothetical protein